MARKGGNKHGKEKSEVQARQELQAKGHLGKEQDEQPGEEFERKEERGRQKGFGKNQGKEATDLTSDRGSRGADNEHS